MAFFEFPHTRTYDSDLGWLIKAFREISAKLDTYLENAVITFADPITWDITEQYTALTCVIDSDGTAYLSLYRPALIFLILTIGFRYSTMTIISTNCGHRSLITPRTQTRPA